MGAVTDPGASLVDGVAEIKLSGADGLHARLSPLYTALSGNVDEANLKLSATLPWTGVHTFQSTKLHLLSSGAAFDLVFACATVFTADRTLSIDTGDANRALTLLSDLEIAANAPVDINNDLKVSLDTVIGFVNLGDSGTGTQTCDLSTYNTFRIHQNGAFTIAMSNEQNGQYFEIWIEADGSNGITWPTNFRWMNSDGTTDSTTDAPDPTGWTADKYYVIHGRYFSSEDLFYCWVSDKGAIT